MATHDRAVPGGWMHVADASGVDIAAECVGQALRRRGVISGEALVTSGAAQWPALAVSLGALRAGVSVLPLPAVRDRERAAVVVRSLRPRLVCTQGGNAAWLAVDEPGCEVVDVSSLLSGDALGDRHDAAHERRPDGTAGHLLEHARPIGRLPPTTVAAAMASLASSFMVRFDVGRPGRHVATVPFWHPDPLAVALGALAAGHDVVLAAEDGVDDILREFARATTTTAFVVPEVLERLVSVASSSGEPSPSLESVVSGIRPCPPELRRATEDWLGPVLYETYKQGATRRLVTPQPSIRHRRVGVWALAAGHGDELAVVEADGSATTRRELVESARRVASAWAARGLGPGSVVGSVLPNSADAVTAYLAAAVGGYAHLPLGTGLPAPRLRELCELHSPALLVTTADGPVLSGVTSATVPALVAEGGGSFDDPGTAGWVLSLSSGSTGLPKAVRRHGQPADLALRAVVDTSLSRWLEMPTAGPHLVTGPFSGGAFRSVALAALHSGQTLLLMRTWVPEHALRLIERFSVTSTFMLPTMMAAMLHARDNGDPHDVSSLTALVHGAAPCSAELKRRMVEWLGPVVHEFYATAEASGTYVLARDWLSRPGTVGRPSPGVSLRILDEDGTSLRAGEVGRVALHSGGFEVKGEDRGSEANYGWAMPGDLGYVDDEGFLFLVGRDCEVMNVGGEKVHAREVEEVLCRHPAVSDAAVLGVGHPTLGECVVAWVEALDTSAEQGSLARDVLRFARQALPVAKAPRRLRVLDALPRTSNGKLDRVALRAAFDGVI